MSLPDLPTTLPHAGITWTFDHDHPGHVTAMAGDRIGVTFPAPADLSGLPDALAAEVERYRLSLIANGIALAV